MKNILPVGIGDSQENSLDKYSPLYEGRKFDELNRRINRDEYGRVVDVCWELGFENVFIQDFQSQDIGIPDFSEEEPFRWG